MIEHAFRSLLLADPAISQTVGTRMYPLRLPRTPAYEAITYQRIDTARGLDHDGPGLTTPRIQVNCWSDDPDKAKQLASHCTRVLHGFRGTVDGQPIGRISVENEADDIDPERDLQLVRLDALVEYVQVPA